MYIFQLLDYLRKLHSYRMPLLSLLLHKRLHNPNYTLVTVPELLVIIIISISIISSIFIPTLITYFLCL